MIGIRNGGFELANTDFWSVTSDGSIIVDAVNQLYGAYCGKFTSSGDASELIFNNDYMHVSAYDLIEIVANVKSNTTRVVNVAINLYDSDYSYIGGLVGGDYIMNNAYIDVISQIILPPGVAYIKVGLHILNSAADEVFYIDGYNAVQIDTRYAAVGHVQIVNLITQGSTGNTLNTPRDLMQYTTYTADLNVDSASGTSPTLDVVLYDTGYEGETISIGTFAQKTGMSHERISLTNGIGRQMVAVYTIGGTDPYFTFQVHITGKR